MKHHFISAALSVMLFASATAHAQDATKNETALSKNLFSSDMSLNEPSKVVNLSTGDSTSCAQDMVVHDELFVALTSLKESLQSIGLSLRVVTSYSIERAIVGMDVHVVPNSTTTLDEATLAQVNAFMESHAFVAKGEQWHFEIKGLENNA